MGQIKVSIIIPVFNAEKYIAKCIESIIKQELSEVEIIIVNDGSNDKSEDIIKYYAFKDSRIITINQTNQGVSAARNRGIEEASGKYITFVDADDYIEKKIYKNMYLNAETNNSDIVCCGVNLVYKDKIKEKIYFQYDKSYKIKNNSTHSFLKNVYLQAEYRTSCWNKLYRSKIIKENIRFEDYSNVHSEDTLFNFLTLAHVRKISVISECLYNHQIVKGSLSHSTKYENVSIRNANQINLMSENIDTSSNNNNLKYLINYYYIKGLSNIAELEINYNYNNMLDLLKEISKYKKMCITTNINYKYNLSKLISSKSKLLYYNSLKIFDYLNLKILLVLVLYMKTKRRMTINDW